MMTLNSVTDVTGPKPASTLLILVATPERPVARLDRDAAAVGCGVEVAGWARMRRAENRQFHIGQPDNRRFDIRQPDRGRFDIGQLDRWRFDVWQAGPHLLLEQPDRWRVDVWQAERHFDKGQPHRRGVALGES